MKFYQVLLVLFIISFILLSGCSRNNTQSSSDAIRKCEEIDYINDKIRCLSEVAIETKNPKICDDIAVKYSEHSDTCYSYITEVLPDPNLCEKIPQIVFRNNCFSKVARKIGDPSICEKIEPDEILANPYNIRDICYYKVASNNKDIIICNKIIDDFQKSICYKEIQS